MSPYVYIVLVILIAASSYTNVKANTAFGYHFIAYAATTAIVSGLMKRFPFEWCAFLLCLFFATATLMNVMSYWHKSSSTTP